MTKRKKRIKAEQKRKERMKLIGILCGLVFCFAAAVPVLIYYTNKNRRVR
ncbi:MAG: hypothetical protein U0M21_04305 [Emergencia sp.]|nr:hypothetical protein [Emergencia sp.]